MKKLAVSVLSSLFTISLMGGCAEQTTTLLPLEQSATISSVEKNTIEKPVFNKRRLGLLETIPTNSANEQKKDQIKLHTYFFKCYSNGAGSYSINDTNEHMKMLTKAASAINLKLDANGDGQVTFDEISKFVTSDAYVKYFRETWIGFSFNKLDTNQDKKLNVDEFNQFNSKIKAANVPDFQLLEEFSDYDYNSNRNLELEEYEDFFMEYLLIRYGINNK